MAVRIDNVADNVARLSDLPNVDPVSWTVWSYIVTDRNSLSEKLAFTNAVGSQYISVTTMADGTTLAIYTHNGNTNGSTSMSVGVWYNIGFVHNGTSMIVYLNGEIEVSRTDTAAISALVGFLVGTNASSAWTNGRFAGLKMWNAALTQAEIQQEMYVLRPVRTANLYGCWPIFPGATERFADYSGYGRTLTTYGSPTLTDEDGPPVSWGARPIFLPYAAAAPPARRVFITHA